MPITLLPISRRRFVGSSLAAGVAALWPGRALAEQGGNPHHFALLSDIHIDENRAFNKEQTTPWETLKQAIGEILTMSDRPAAVMVNGDLACHGGTRGDYRTVLDAVAPIRQGGLPLHMTMGNHDARRNFFSVLPPDATRQKNLPDRVVNVIEAPRANFFMLDSLEITTKSPGSLGPGQLAWLAKALDAHKTKPAIVMVHHDPLPDPGVKPKENYNTDSTDKTAKPGAPSGLLDTKAFYDIIMPRKWVKAYVFGHTHDWQYASRDDLHLINLPPTAWLFKAGRPQGWVDLYLTETGASFELRCLDTRHPQHGEKLDLKWR